MKCQFCNQRCRLLKEGEPDYNDYRMMWLCEKHPTRVLHHVELDKYSLRRDRSIQGVSRFWNLTTVSWVNEKGQLISAFYYRREDNYEPDPDEEEMKFAVYHVILDKRGNWANKYDKVFALNEYPKELTPENLPKRVAALVAFS